MSESRGTAPESTLDSATAEVVEGVLREWERANLGPEGAGVRRGMALEIRLAMRRTMTDLIMTAGLERIAEREVGK